MRGLTWKRVLVCLPATLLAVIPLAAQQTPQSSDPVADAARKAREQKKDEPKPKKVYTDDDVKPAEAPPAPAQPAAEGQAEAGSDQTGAAGSVAKGKEDPNGEEAWRKRFADQRTKIAKAQEELDVLQRELEKAQVQYYPDPQQAMKQQLTRNDINEKAAKIQAKKAEIEKLNEELSDMEDQLRKNGGDPGWARP
jgi:hypothetical protein